MKKILSLITIFLLAFSTLTVSFAAPNEVDSNIVEKDITYEEYIQQLAESEGISREDAVELDKKQTADFEKKLSKKLKKMSKKELAAMNLSALDLNEVIQTSSSDYSYKTVEKTQSLGSGSHFSAKLRATLKIYSNGSFRQIAAVQSLYSRRVSGIGTYDWIEKSSWYDPAPPTISIRLQGSGYFEVQTYNSAELGVDIEFFSLSGSVGQYQIYQSDDLDIVLNYSVY